MGNHHQSLSCRGNEDIPVSAQRSLPHRQFAVQCRQVESRVCHLPRGIVVSQNTIHADNQESSVAAPDIVSWCAARRFVVLHFHRLPVIHLEPCEGSEVVASPDAVLVVFEYPTEEIVGLLYAESLFQGDMVISLADAVQSVARCTNQDIPIAVLHQGTHPGLYAVGKSISHEITVLIVVAGQSFTAPHPQSAVLVAQQLHHFIVNNRRGIVLFIDISREPVAVKFVQSIFRSYPEVTIFVLTDTFNETARELA